MTALGMILAAGGVVLVWCGIRDEDPRQVIAGVFTRNQGSVPTAPPAQAVTAQPGYVG
jgi:hypothetical protein